MDATTVLGWRFGRVTHSVKNFLARPRAVWYPSAISMFSMIIAMSGTITVTGRKSTLSDSGSSARPR